MMRLVGAMAVKEGDWWKFDQSFSQLGFNHPKLALVGEGFICKDMYE
jgi:hypothetical protein